MVIEDELGKVPGVEKSIASSKRGTVEIFYESKKPDDKKIEEAVMAGGYSLGSAGKKSFLSKNPSDYKDLGLAFIFVLALHFILQDLGLANINLAGPASAPSSFLVIILVGLTAGVSSCMVVVGGLVLGISTRYAEKHPEATALQKFKPHLYFNLGRVLGFALLGGLLGILGSVIQFSSLALAVITVLVGLVMLVMGLQLIEIFPVLSSFKLTLPKSLSRILGLDKRKDKETGEAAFPLGVLTFFLPCGFTQAMQIFAVSTGSFLGGALVMGTFALGTVPGLLGIGGLTSAVRGTFARRFFKFAGVLVILFALVNIRNGFTLGGLQINPAAQTQNSNQITAATPAADSAPQNDPNVTLENGVQVVKMVETGEGYSPDRFTIKKGLSVKWEIDGQEPYSCASTIEMPAYNISRHLSSGENEIEFTPTQIGTIAFSCSMGMYTGEFIVK
jgi:sulfite exporter TauE/SafE/copper chaperone CopZ